MNENVSALMHKKLNTSLCRVLETAGLIALENGFNLYLVGGAVRDLFLDLPIIDIDIVVEPIEINETSLKLGPFAADIFAKFFSSKVSAVSQFGTAKIEIKGFQVDVSTSRSEIYPYFGSLPVVQANSIYNDLERRDFTVNSIAINLLPEYFGNVLDPFNGLGDLKKKLLQIHHPDSFQDDATRILRGIRYQSRLGFAFSDTTEENLINNLSFLKEISGDRIRNELSRIFDEDKAVEILKIADDLGILSEIHPALSWNDTKALGYNFLKTHKHDLGNFVYVAFLILEIKNEDAEALKIRLNTHGIWSEVISDMVLLNNRMPALMQADVRRSYIYDALLELNDLTLLARGAVQNNKMISDILCNFEVLKADAKLEIDGSKLIELGIPEGKHIGEILLELQHKRLDGEIRNSIDEERLVYEKLKMLGFRPNFNE